MISSVNRFLIFNLFAALAFGQDDSKWRRPHGSCSDTLVTVTCPPTGTSTVTYTCLTVTTIQPSESDTTTTILTSSTRSCSDTATTRTFLTSTLTTEVTRTLSSGSTTFVTTTAIKKVKKWCKRRHEWCDYSCECCHAPEPNCKEPPQCIQTPCLQCPACPPVSPCPVCPPAPTVIVTPSQYCVQMIVSGPTPVSIDTESLIASVSSHLFK